MASPIWCVLEIFLTLVLLGAGRASYAQFQIPPENIADKIAEFDAMRAKDIGWNSSKVIALTRDIFERSIKENRISDFPRAKQYQRYNYVVKDGKILVAVWTITGTVKAACRGAPLSPGDYVGGRITRGMMINFFPEDTYLPNSHALGSVPKTCESMASSGKVTGVLDGHSKHFLLVQGVDTHLSDYRPNISGPAWAEKEVDYAGEIIVDVKNCYYIINQNSGTYQPRGGERGNFNLLFKVAALFERTTSVAPVAVWDTRTPTIIPTTTYRGTESRQLDCGGHTGNTKGD
jgi:hypothetical protein